MPKIEFEHSWGGKETTLQKIKKWISKQKPPFNTILKYLFSYIEKWYWDGKVLETMAGVDLEVKKLNKEKSLIAFIGAPWTLLVYMIGAKQSKNEIDLNFEAFYLKISILGV